MPFQPEIDQQLPLEGVIYRFVEDPVTEGRVFSKQGQQSAVYQVRAGEQKWALKVFEPQYRTLSLVNHAGQIASYSQIPGLSVCRRTVLAPQRHPMLLRKHPDLMYAVLMPWVEGPTWSEMLAARRELSPEQCLELAKGLASTLSSLESHGVAHCDLNSSNLCLPLLSNPTAVAVTHNAPTQSIELVDLEQMYESTLTKPRVMAPEDAAYRLKPSAGEEWGPTGDRFSGALLLAEMLCWLDEGVRSSSWERSYFSPDEVQIDSTRYETLTSALRQHWGEAASALFQQVWLSTSLNGCPTLGEWLSVVSKLVVRTAIPLVEPTKHPKLQVSVSALDLGTLAPGKTASGEFEIVYGNGHIVSDANLVQVAPSAFGPEATHIRVQARPIAGGALFTVLKLVSGTEEIELPVVAQWASGVAAPAMPSPAGTSDLILICSACGKQNAANEIYCQGCAHQLLESRVCPFCKSSIPVNARHCTECGRALV